MKYLEVHYLNTLLQTVFSLCYLSVYVILVSKYGILVYIWLFPNLCLTSHYESFLLYVVSCNVDWIILHFVNLWFIYLFIYLAALRLRCGIQPPLPKACGILVPWPGIEPASSELEGGFFFTSEHQGKSPTNLFLLNIIFLPLLLSLSLQ